MLTVLIIKRRFCEERNRETKLKKVSAGTWPGIFEERGGF